MITVPYLGQVQSIVDVKKPGEVHSHILQWQIFIFKTQNSSTIQQTANPSMECRC